MYTIGKTLDEMTKEWVTDALIAYEWNIVKTAKALDVTRATIYRMIKRYNIQRPA